MPHYKLVASGRRPELKADEIVLSRHADSGEPEHTLSFRKISEIPDDLLPDARNLAYRLGLEVVEVDAPEESEEDNSEGDQEAGADSAGQAPAVSSTGQSGAEIDQQATAKQGARAVQQNAPGAAAQTSQSGTPGSSATPSNS